jgi:hypothetical protein
MLWTGERRVDVGGSRLGAAVVAGTRRNRAEAVAPRSRQELPPPASLAGPVGAPHFHKLLIYQKF